ncbi:hypothetical protein LOD99_13701 [Oopsacas minuta]|uniref:Ribonuclease n=1 Tax=Oopsacas minuta TaxID=111878 RepID=A0AAV7KIC8_9METZ|nr:hypothetical protein LOD99_13701 [Oopsacas minuta]
MAAGYDSAESNYTDDECSTQGRDELISNQTNILGEFYKNHREEEYNRGHNLELFPESPDVTFKESCIVGIDEAGRGPVLGPMVYGICYCPVSKTDTLASLGFADSKELKPSKRDTLMQIMIQQSGMIGRGVEVLSPNYISNCMLARDKINLNVISHNTAIRMIRRLLERGVNISLVLLDTVGDAKSYEKKLNKEFEGKFKIEVHIKADSKFPIVGAASICAKVVRDWCLDNWVFKENVNFTSKLGSGYTGDPNTKAWLSGNLDKVFGYPNIVRFGWSTCRKKLEKAYQVEWEDEEDNDNPKIESFFGKGKVAKSHPFFTERFLENPK